MDESEELARLIEACNGDTYITSLPAIYKDWESFLSDPEASPSSRELVEHLMRPKYEFAHDKMCNVGDHQFRVNPVSLAQWAVRRVANVGAAEAAAEIDRHTGAGFSRGICVSAVKGLTVDRSYAIDDSTLLVPFHELPDSPQKESIRPSDSTFRQLASLDVGLRFISDAITNAPDSALVSTVAIRPPYLDPGFEGNENEFGGSAPDHGIVLLLATLVLDVAAPAVVSGWWSLADDVPFSGIRPGVSYRQSLNEVTPRKDETIDARGIAELRELVEKYRELEKGEKRVIRISASRLNQCINRADPVQKSIDLGVSLEALLVRPENADQLSHQFRVVGAWLTGDTVHERQRNHDLLKAVYSLRSKAVHNGELGTKKVRVGGSKINHNEVVEEGIRLAKIGIRRAIRRGGLSKECCKRIILGG